MPSRWLAAVLVLAAAPAAAQPPAELPLLPVPAPAPPPPPYAPRGPVGEYDHNRLYLPEPGPEFDHVVDHAPPELWRVAMSAELAWLSTRPYPGALKLTPPDVFGNPVPGLGVPLDGRGAGGFNPGVGLGVGRRVGERSELEGNFLFLVDTTRGLTGGAPGALVSFGAPGRDAPLIVRYPPALAGLGSTFPATVSTGFASLDLNYRHSLIRTETARVDALVGYRYARLTDQLYLGEPPDDAEHTAYQQNRLQTLTEFHGGQFGAAAGVDYGDVFWDGVVKIAYGSATLRTTATGAFAYTDPTPRLGSRTRGAVVPAAAARVGYRFGPHASVFASYSFQYLDRVARLGDAFGPEPARSDLWVQALGLGFEFRF